MLILKEEALTSYRKVVRRDEFRTNCVFCADNKLHLYVNTTYGVFYCFKCNARGKYLGSYAPPIPPQPKKTHKIIPPTQKHIVYLVERGCDIDDLLTFSPVCVDGYADYVFSTYDPTLLVGRNINDEEPKHMQLGDNTVTKLFGTKWLRKRQPLYIVEGILDLIALRNYAKKTNVMALLGKAITRYQHTFIQSLSPSIVYLILDSPAKDHRIHTNIEENCRILYPLEVKVIELTEGDPWEMRNHLKEVIP